MSRNKVKYLLKKSQQETASKILNKKFLLSLLTKLALKEEETLKENYAKGKRFMRSEGDAYQLEKFKIEHLQFKIEDPIAMGSDNMIDWRERYYRHYYGVEEDLEEFVEKLVEHYLMGIKWVTIYYFDNCPGWEWYFPFDHPPFLTDIVKYFKTFRFNKFKFTKCKALEPVQQLLTVLPPQSHMLLPEKFRKLMTNTNSSLAYLYPTEFTQDFINKSKYWMAIPNLPPLDIQLIKHIYEKYNN
jgi:5'-3' exonuclease